MDCSYFGRCHNYGSVCTKLQLHCLRHQAGAVTQGFQSPDRTKATGLIQGHCRSVRSRYAQANTAYTNALCPLQRFMEQCTSSALATEGRIYPHLKNLGHTGFRQFAPDQPAHSLVIERNKYPGPA